MVIEGEILRTVGLSIQHKIIHPTDGVSIQRDAIDSVYDPNLLI